MNISRKFQFHLIIQITILEMSWFSTFLFAQLQNSFFEVSALRAINRLRNFYQTNPLLLDSNLTNSAQNYAVYLARQDLGTASAADTDLINCASQLLSSTNTTNSCNESKYCGENLAFSEMNSTTKPIDICNPELIIQIWESEKYYYNYTSPPANDTTKAQVAQFTQMVW